LRKPGDCLKEVYWIPEVDEVAVEAKMTEESKRGDRMPVAYVPHGGGPWPFVDIGMARGEVESLKGYLESLRHLPKVAPKALLIVSAHWEEAVPTVMTSDRPPMLYDYYGFPESTYSITWPAPGAPALASRVRALLRDARIDSAVDPARGFDHGAFVPFKLTYPAADVPALQLSLQAGLDPAAHLAIGKAIAPLRDEGVFVLGSGMSYHNLRAIRDHAAGADAKVFDTWLGETMEQQPGERDRRLIDWANAPAARRAHPREEHLLPLMVIAGAAGSDRATLAFRGSMMDKQISAFHFG
jgi:aromatic ring-opening dioxygenase catalytic subunit (LigB family)